MNARPQPNADATPTLRLRRLYNIEADEGEPAEDLSDAQVDSMLMPPPLPQAGDRPFTSAPAADRSGLRWAVLFSMTVWAALLTWLLAG
jgi:hypothetical protein